MLGGKSQLPARVMLCQLANEGVVWVEQRIVEANAAAHEHLFHARQGTELAQ